MVSQYSLPPGFTGGYSRETPAGVKTPNLQTDNTYISKFLFHPYPL